MAPTLSPPALPPSLARSALVKRLWQAHFSELYSSRWGDHNAVSKSTNLPTASYKELRIGDGSDTYKAWADDGWIKQHNKVAGWGPTMQVLKYYVERIGTPPNPGNGYPLYIAMHGGGEEKTVGANDAEWDRMTRYYKGRITHSSTGGIYVALRGIGNTWDLHFAATGHVLVERLIENMILFENVDPNKVYLMGFSAGGDAVFRLANRLAQRFAASNAGGGNPGEVEPMNFLNVPICLQVGEQDVGITNYGRSRNVAQFGVALGNSLATTLAKLPQNIRNVLPPPPASAYFRNVYIHPTGPWTQWNLDYGSKHAGWEKVNFDCSPVDKLGAEVKIINNYEKWAIAYAASPEQTVNSTVEQEQNRASVNTNAIDWLNARNPRNPVPELVLWNLGIPAKGQDNWGHVKDLTGRSQNYWLDIGDKHYSQEPGTWVGAWLDKDHNRVIVLSAQNYLRILLRPGMLDLSKPVSVVVGTDSLSVNVGTADNETVIRRTLGRNDPNLIFTTDIVLTKGEKGWIGAPTQQPT